MSGIDTMAGGLASADCDGAICGTGPDSPVTPVRIGAVVAGVRGSNGRGLVSDAENGASASRTSLFGESSVGGAGRFAGRAGSCGRLCATNILRGGGAGRAGCAFQ